MKTIKSMTAALLLLMTTTLMANHITDHTSMDTPIHKELTKLLKGPNFHIDHEMKGIAHIIVNDNNELIVISVTTEDKELESYVKSRLNYRRVKSKMDIGKPYLIPIRMTVPD